jgi:hypothetical protein
VRTMTPSGAFASTEITCSVNSGMARVALKILSTAF